MVRKPAADMESEAARWFVRWNDATETVGAKEQSRWFGWLQRSPRHVAEYFAMDDLSARLSESKMLRDFDVDEWMTARRADVIRLQDAPASRQHAPEIAARGIARKRWAAAASLAFLALAALVFWQLSWNGNSYRTDVGEQKTVRLADGSVLELNTRSELRVAYTEDAREIELKGEALFTVAQDARRPFRVRTPDTTVQALGTRFNVYEQGTATRVAVLEGRVRVSSSFSSEAFDLTAGEEAEVTHRAIRKDSKPNVKLATAWQSRTLVFERASLADVAREFNRYNTMQFKVEGLTGTSNRLSGTFDAQHPESLLLWLQSREDLLVERSGDAYTVRTREPRG